jgi:hypothetical protein
MPAVPETIYSEAIDIEPTVFQFQHANSQYFAGPCSVNSSDGTFGPNAMNSFCALMFALTGADWSLLQSIQLIASEQLRCGSGRNPAAKK